MKAREGMIMNSLKLGFALLIFALVAVTAGCGSTGGGISSSGGMSDSATDPALASSADITLDPSTESSPAMTSCPDWFHNPPRDAKNFFATATEVDADADAAFARARQNCRNQFEKEIVNNFRQLVAGVQFQRRLADDSELLAEFNQALEKAPDLALQEAAVTKREDQTEGDLQRVCLLMELRRRAVDQAVYDVVVADEKLYAAAKEGENFQVWEDYLKGKFDEE
jgi:hypothetical protein